METTIKHNQIKASSEIKKINSRSSFWEKMEFSRFGIIAMLVVIVGCSGGVAASYGAGDSIIKLAMIAFPSIISLALVLAVAPMRAIIYTSAIALVLDILVFVF